MRNLLDIGLLTEIDVMRQKNQEVTHKISECCKEKFAKISKFLKYSKKSKLFDQDCITEVKFVYE
jgi:hypothetical protein